MKYLAIAIAAALVLTACGKEGATVTSPSISGKYQIENGTNTLTFGDGKVKTILLGETIETPFTVESAVVKFQFQGGVPQSCEIKDSKSMYCATRAARYVKVD